MPRERAWMNKVAAAGFVGALLEWYDFYIFATGSALVFGQVFFPDQDPLASTMAAFGAFAAGFVARPLGGVLFGHIGDRIGRKASLVATLVIIGIGTFLVGLLPSFDAVGILAPALLVLLRVVQGIGLGGEYGGASLITIEHAPRAERGFWGSLPQAASPAGLLLATGVFGLVSLLPGGQFLAWGWRVPFLLSAVALAIGLYIRLSVDETPEFARSRPKREERAPALELLRAHRRNTLLSIGARLAETVSGNTIKSFGLTYVTLQLGLAREMALDGLVLTGAIAIVATPIFGALGDRFRPRHVYMLGAALAAVLAFPFFWVLDWRTPLAVWLGFVVAYNLGPTMMLSVQPSLFVQLFDPRVRYTGLSIAYQVSSIVGGFTPLIALWLLRLLDGRPWGVAAFLAVIAVVSFCCTSAAVRRERGRDRPDLR
ncbi:MAG TPA: MFS transporter [Stellaceae bacterium]|nr:MFS transporter [Stellaceae bacterium]